jgi:nucleoside-diphosphate-sugar epimerase
MRVFLAGGSGTIGVPLIRELQAAGHDVTALTRSAATADRLRAIGATPAVADALDADSLRRVVVDARPTHVLHELTALPKGGPRSARELEPTNRLRIDGTRHLIAAAVAAGAKRIVAGSFALFGDDPIESLPAMLQPAATAVRSMETQVLEASRRGVIEGVVLRYGLFYGLDTPSTRQMMALARRRMLPAIRGDRSLLSCIHVDDAARATVAALDTAPAGSVYAIVDDRALSISDINTAVATAAGAPRPLAIPSWLPRLIAPYLVKVISTRLPLSNQPARTDLGWSPWYSTMDEGLKARPRSERAA